jgi:hypothetical protein
MRPTLSRYFPQSHTVLRAQPAFRVRNIGGDFRASERKIMDQTRHRSVAMVRRYIRDGNLFRDNISGQLGL